MTGIVSSELAVSTGSYQGVTSPIKVEGLDGVCEPKERRSVFLLLNIPEFDGVVASCCCYSVRCSRVEHNLADFSVRAEKEDRMRMLLKTTGQMLVYLPATSGNLCARGEIFDSAVCLQLLCIHVQDVEYGVFNLPNPDLSVVAGGNYDGIIEWGKGSVQYSSGMSSAEWVQVWEFSRLRGWNDGECSTTSSLPVEGEVFLVGSKVVCVPGVIRRADVLIAYFRLCGVAIDMAVF